MNKILYQTQIFPYIFKIDLLEIPTNFFKPRFLKKFEILYIFVFLLFQLQKFRKKIKFAIRYIFFIFVDATPEVS